MTRERRIGLTIVVSGVFLLLVAVAVYMAHETRSLYYTIIFKDAQGIRAGDRVQMGGVDIGVVKWVQLHSRPVTVDVRVKVSPEHAPKVRADSTAIIRGVSFPNVSGQRVIEVINSGSEPPSPALSKDSVVYGMNGLLELEVWKLKQKLQGGKGVSETLGAWADNMKNLSRAIQELAASPRVKQAVQDLQAFLGKMRDKGRDAIDQLKAEWPKIKEELRPAMKELQDFGRDYLAEQIRQIMDQIDQTLKSWTRPLASPTPTPSPTPTASPLTV
jgi:ABC-type transporter Mla subunit MlaD